MEVPSFILDVLWLAAARNISGDGIVSHAAE